MLGWLLVLSAANPAQAFQNGGIGGGAGFRGGAGFTGSPGGGFTGPRGGGFTESLGGYPGAYDPVLDVNRSPSFVVGSASLPRRSGNRFGTGNRFNSATNLDLLNAIKNVNRKHPSNKVNVNRMGVGWNNPYRRYHHGWVSGYWQGSYPAGLLWRPFDNGLPGPDGAASGGGLPYGVGMDLMMGMGWGPLPWLYGPMLYDFGYANYHNPYFGGYAGAARQPSVADYSRPINPQNTPPAQAVIVQAVSTLDFARQTFKRGEFAGALELVDRARSATPDDTTLHEFRALTLFALQRYDEAASALYAVLSIGPGWDWPTVISLYGHPDTYTQQLRALEAFVKQNPNTPAAHFVVAYHYLTGEHADAAVRQFKLATTLQPNDILSAQLIEQLEQPQVAAAGIAQQAASTAAAPTVQSADETAPTGTKRKIEGTWTAHPRNDMNIGVTFQQGGRFTWRVSRQGKDQQFQGQSTYEAGILILVQDQHNNTMAGNLHWTDETHFVFKVIGAGPGDPGLSFTRTS
jgi:tetratricopeptide (TPR) repeat protein